MPAVQPRRSATAQATARLAPALERSSAEWALLRARLRTITPQALGRGTLIVTVALITAWLAASTWPALLPFAVGGIIAYAVFPIVGWLDRFMPRPLAALLATGFAVAIIVGVFAVIVPPLLQQALTLLTNLPGSADLQHLKVQVDDYLATLPDTTRLLVQGVLDRVATQFHAGLSGLLDVIAAFLVENTVHLFSAIGALLGIILLPIWMLAAVHDGKGMTAFIERQLAPGIRPDVMAILRIVHRAMSTFLRVQVAASLLTGVGVWAGLTASGQLGGPAYPQAIAIAAFAGVVQVLPQIGWLFGLLPTVVGLIVRPGEPLVPIVYLAVYLVVLRLVGFLVGARLGRDLNVRAAIAFPAFVVISEIGPVWLLLSAPLLVVSRDVIVYLRGRLSEPPTPAGVLPHELAKVRPVAARPAPIPPLYAAAPLAAGRPAAPRPAAAPPTPAAARLVRPAGSPAVPSGSVPPAPVGGVPR